MLTLNEALTVERFADWVRRHHGKTVGIVNNCARCPLALYLQEQTGQNWNVGMKEIYLYDKRTGKHLQEQVLSPAFLLIVNRVDRLNAVAEHAVSAEEVEIILDSLPEEN